jgi:hypothetical protein
VAKFDANALSKLDWSIIGAGGVTFIALFLPWYGVSFGPFSFTADGFNTSWGWLGGLLIVAAGVYQLLHRSQVNLSKMPIGPAVTVLGAAALGTFIVILRWLTLSTGVGPRFGMIVTLILGIVQVVCALNLFKASGEALPWAGSKTQSGQVPPSL